MAVAAPEIHYDPTDVRISGDADSVATGWAGEYFTFITDNSVEPDEAKWNQS